MNAPAESPTTATETSNDSALTKFIKGLPKEKANKSDQKAAGAKFKAFQAKKAAAIKALKDLETEEGEVARECIRVFRKDSILFEGRQFTPTSRDERIYYKEMSGKGIEI